MCVKSASTHEVTLVEKTLDHNIVKEELQRTIEDKAYESERLDQRQLEEQSIEMIVPHRMNRRRIGAVTQDRR